MPDFGVAVFPGSNCDYDAYHALKVLGANVRFIWHREEDLSSVDVLVLPGGFSYGDYLRTGAIARFSPLMQAVPGFLARGGLVIGICNGFQILLETGLLPGAMLPNRKLKFICKHVNLRVERNDTPFTRNLKKGDVLSIPIAHHGGNYYAPPEVLERIERNGQVLLRYCDEQGNIVDEANPNGSLNNIAGLMNEDGNVFGLMPHPERACESILGSVDGAGILTSLIESVK